MAATENPPTLDRPAESAKRRGARPTVALLMAATLALGTFAIPAMALDGCLVLLCLAAPSWSAIPQCVPPIRQLLRDLALGRGFPTCAMAGAGNSASHQWATAPGNCPLQYTRVIEGVNWTSYECDYAGAVEVNVQGTLWTRTWWGMGGDTVTEYTPAARAALHIWDPRFDNEYAAWLASQVSP